MLNLIKKYKLVFLILVELLLIYLIYILSNVPASSGYEPSLYAMYPDTFWVIYFIICLFSLSALIYSIFIKHNRLFFGISLFNLSILIVIILLQPLFRNYFAIAMGDCSNHLALIKDILSAQHLAAPETTANPYPITHILSATIMLITQIKLEAVGYITPLLYYFIYVLFTYLLGRELYKNNQKSMLLLLFILVPILHSYAYYPSQSLFFLIPMLLYALVKGMKKVPASFRYIIVILLVTLPLLHPVSSLLLILFFAIICLAGYFSRAKNFSLRSYITTPLIFGVVWLLWTTSLEGHFAGWIRYYINWFLSPFEQYSYYKVSIAGLEAAELPLIDAIILYIKKYGPMHLLFGMASVFSLYTIGYNWIKKKTDKLNTALSLICLVYVALYIFSFFFTVPLLGDRIHPYVVLVSISVNVTFLFNLVNGFKTKIKKTIPLILMITLLFSMTYIATFNLYDSPFNRRPPAHGTYMCLNGMDWLLQTRNKDLEVKDLEHRQSYYAIYLLGHKKASLEPNLKSIGAAQTIPPHFNYDNEALLAKTFGEDCYLFIDKRTELVSVNIYPEYEDRWSFHPDDYEKLESDESIDKIYHNGEIKIFFVNGRRWSQAD